MNTTATHYVLEAWTISIGFALAMLLTLSGVALYLDKKLSAQKIAGILLVTLAFLTPASALTLNWNNPIDSSQTNFGSYSSEQNLTFEIDLGSVSSNGQLDVYSKAPGDASFTDDSTIPGTSVQSSWDDFTEMPVSSSSQEFVVTNGSSKTVATCGNEHTVTLNEWSSSDSETVNVSFDGNSGWQTEGEANLIDDGSCAYHYHFVSVDKNNESVKIQTKKAKYEHLTGYHEYRAYWDSSTAGDIISFSVSKSGNNLPRTNGITVDGKSLSAGASASSITPNSSIDITLNDPNGDNLHSVGVYEWDPSSKTTGDQVYYDEYTGSATDSPINDGDTVTVSTQDQAFLSKKNTTYHFIVDLTDKADSSTTRRTLYTTLDTGTGDASVYNTTINKIECRDSANSTWKKCSNFNFDSTNDRVSKLQACGDWKNVNFQYVNFSMASGYDYGQKHKFKDKNYTGLNSKCFRKDINWSNEWNGYIQDSGAWNVTVEVKQKNGYTTNNTTSWNQPWGNLTVESWTVNGSTSGPVNVTHNKNFTVEASVKCSGGECASETNSTHNVSETVKIWLDPIPSEEGGETKVERKGRMAPGSYQLSNQEVAESGSRRKSMSSWERVVLWILEGVTQ